MFYGFDSSLMSLPPRSVSEPVPSTKPVVPQMSTNDELIHKMKTMLKELKDIKDSVGKTQILTEYCNKLSNEIKYLKAQAGIEAEDEISFPFYLEPELTFKVHIKVDPTNTGRGYLSWTVGSLCYDPTGQLNKDE